MSRVSRQDWLLAGLQVLREHGDAAVTVDRLCAALEKTKGSFYHHFVDLDGFKAALLTVWEDELTARPIAAAEAALDDSANAAANHAARADRLDDVVAGLDHALDRAVRAWGLRDERVRAAVAHVDRRRIDYLEELLRAAGHPQAALFAQLEYVCFLGLQHLDGVDQPAAREALRVASREVLAGRVS